MKTRTYYVTVTLLFTNGREVLFPLNANYAYEAMEDAKNLFPDYSKIEVMEDR